MGERSREPLVGDSDAPANDAGAESTHVRATHPLAHLPDAIAPSSSQLCAAGTHASLPPPAAARFGRYDVLGRVAVGGMAEIFFARESSAGGGVRHLGLKLLKRRAKSDGDGAYFEELFQREGRTAMLLAHPNICHVYEFGKVEDRFFIAMEWIAGRSLRDVVSRLAERGESIPSALAVAIAIQVADALHYAHDARDARGRSLGVVHRDVNPQNIMLRFDGSAQLLDFGVAHVNEPQQDTRASTVKGKLGYMAPEQLLAGDAIDRRADVFALGVCLYEMLSGTRLYKRGSTRETLKAVVSEPAPSLSAAIAPELDAILQRALDKRPELRFQTAGELQDALEGFLAKSGEVASRRRIAELMRGLFPGESDDLQPALDASSEVMAHVASRAPTTADGADLTARPWRRPALAALMCALAIAVGAWLATSGEPRRPAAPVVRSAPAAAAPAPMPVLPAAEPGSAAPAPERAAPIDEPPSGGRARTREGSRTSRRRSPAFVAEPGF